MSTKDFLNIGRETTKGSALQDLKDAGAAGAQDFAILDLSGVVVDTETFTLGDDVYEINLIATDNGLDTGTGGLYNNDAKGPIQVPLTSAQVDVGDIILIGTEFMKVVAVGPSSSTVVRGYAGSTIAAHADSQTILEAVQQIVAASDFAVPVAATTAATAKVEIATAVNSFSLGINEQLGQGTAKVDQAALIVEAFVGGGTDAVVFHLPADKGVPDSAETFTNGTITAFGGGVEAASQQYSVIWRVVSMADASANLISVVAPFDVTEAVVTVYAATGALKITQVAAGDAVPYNGVVTVTGSRLVEMDNAGTADFAENDIVKIEFFA